jgi:hypothetical protein
MARQYTAFKHSDINLLLQLLGAAVEKVGFVNHSAAFIALRQKPL